MERLEEAVPVPVLVEALLKEEEAAEKLGAEAEVAGRRRRRSSQGGAKSDDLGAGLSDQGGLWGNRVLVGE